MKMTTKRRELVLFVVHGVITVVIAYICMRLFLKLGISLPIATSLGFIGGTLYAYAANGKNTFESDLTLAAFGRFILLYGVALLIHMRLTIYAKDNLFSGEYSLLFSFCLATIFTATINFFGMKHFVFKKTKSRS